MTPVGESGAHRDLNHGGWHQHRTLVERVAPGAPGRWPRPWEAASFDLDYRLVNLEQGIGRGLMCCRDDMPVYVTIYVAVSDLEATLAKAKDLGRTPLVPPTRIPGVGAFALLQGPKATRSASGLVAHGAKLGRRREPARR